MSEKFRALGRNILVEKVENELEKKGSIFIMDKVKADTYILGRVVSASQGYYEKNKFIKMSVKAGDKIIFKPESGIQLDKKLFINEDHIFAIVE